MIINFETIALKLSGGRIGHLLIELPDINMSGFWFVYLFVCMFVVVVFSIFHITM